MTGYSSLRLIRLADDHEAEMYSGGTPESFLIKQGRSEKDILNGDNILAVEVHNTSATSTDLSSNVWLSFGITDSSNLFRQVPEWFVPI